MYIYTTLWVFSLVSLVFGRAVTRADDLSERQSAADRPYYGNLPYGVAISNCVTPGTVALTFDDGPGPYTARLLDFLAANQINATFFITGSRVGGGTIETLYPAVIRRMHREGHQIAAHSWTHPNFEAISSARRVYEMTRTETAFKTILGFYPTYMRPPYGFCYGASGCLTDMANLGYHVILWNVDTKDYENDTPRLIQTSKNKWDVALASGSPATSAWLPLTHDVHQQTVTTLTPYMVSTTQAAGYRFVTVGECMGDPRENWYRTG